MHSLQRTLLSLSLFAIAGSAHAYTFQLDTFALWKNFDTTAAATPAGLLALTPVFLDTFSDGSPPPSAPNFTNGSAAAYGLSGGSTVGPEANSILTMDISGATANAQGVLRQQAILLTNNSDAAADIDKGLKQSNTNFAVGGIFNFVNPGNNNGSYGVRFVDTTGGSTGNDFVGLSVHGTTSGGAVVEMIQSNNVTGVNTVLETQSLDTTHGQIGLGLYYGDGDSNPATEKAVYAAYFYLDNGVAGNFNYLAASQTIFHGETWTRAAFYATDTAPVPEPTEYALMLAGLGLVGWKAHRNRA